MPDESQYLPRTPANYSSNSDPISFTRTICGGLILPTIATIFGKLLFQRVNSNFQRSIIGGIAFVGLKGIFKIYYKQQQFLRQAHRQIKNFEAAAAAAAAKPNYQQQQQQQQSAINAIQLNNRRSTTVNRSSANANRVNSPTQPTQINSNDIISSSSLLTDDLSSCSTSEPHSPNAQHTPDNNASFFVDQNPTESTLNSSLNNVLNNITAASNLIDSSNSLSSSSSTSDPNES